MKKRKSQKLTESELRDLKRIQSEFDTSVEFCIFFHLPPATMIRAIQFGKSSPETVDKIRKGISKYQHQQNCITV